MIFTLFSWLWHSFLKKSLNVPPWQSSFWALHWKWYTNWSFCALNIIGIIILEILNLKQLIYFNILMTAKLKRHISVPPWQNTKCAEYSCICVLHHLFYIYIIAAHKACTLSLIMYVFWSKTMPRGPQNSVCPPPDAAY